MGHLLEWAISLVFCKLELCLVSFELGKSLFVSLDSYLVLDLTLACVSADEVGGGVLLNGALRLNYRKLGLHIYSTDLADDRVSLG